MPRIDPVDRRHTQVYSDVVHSPLSLLDVNNCAVIAVCIATSEPYDKVHEMFLAKGRKLRRGVRTSTIEEVMNDLGYDMVVRLQGTFISRYPSPHCKVLHFVTTHHPARFNKVWADGKTYLFSTGGHILCVKDGVNHDWTKGRAKRVKVVYEVVKQVQS